MISFSCQICSEKIQARNGESGQKIPCPYCGEMVRVPVGDTTPLGIIIGVILLILGACGYPALSIVLGLISALGERSSIKMPVMHAQIASTDGKTSVTAPVGWTTRPLDERATLQIANAGEDLYLTVRTYPKAGYAPGMTHREHAKLTLAELMLECADPRKTVGPNERVLDGRAAVQYEMAGVPKHSQVRMAYLQTTVEGKDDFFQILAWTKEARMPAQRRKLDVVLNTFREAANAPGR